MNIFQRGRLSLKRWFDTKASRVNREAVIQDIIPEVEMPGGFCNVCTHISRIALTDLFCSVCITALDNATHLKIRTT